MDQQLFEFIRDRFEAVEESHTGIHRKLDVLKAEQVNFNIRIEALESERPPKRKRGVIIGGIAAAAAFAYELYTKLK